MTRHAKIQKIYDFLGLAVPAFSSTYIPFSLQVTQLTEKLKNQSESHKQAQENLHEQVQEQKAHLRAAQDRVLSLEANITELTSQLNESKEKVSQLDVQVMELWSAW